ncbi:MAG TPA: hypothetical protein VJN29_19225, partial [Intrasporangium sp.]|uniref:hypothetical protein n=1 Tax=Intrasporangium sp. TaxID=1925024 RepID=UPI002B48F8B9
PSQAVRRAWKAPQSSPEAAERHQTQYFEMFCNRGHLPPGLDGGDPSQHPWAFGAELPAFDDDTWELYGPDDWTQALGRHEPRTARLPAPR